MRKYDPTISYFTDFENSAEKSFSHLISTWNSSWQYFFDAWCNLPEARCSVSKDSRKLSNDCLKICSCVLPSFPSICAAEESCFANTRLLPKSFKRSQSIWLLFWITNWCSVRRCCKSCEAAWASDVISSHWVKCSALVNKRQRRIVLWDDRADRKREPGFKIYQS